MSSASSKLLDSRKFCMLMDVLARTWASKKATDEDKEMRLDAILPFIRQDLEEQTISGILGKAAGQKIREIEASAMAGHELDDDDEPAHAPGAAPTLSSKDYLAQQIAARGSATGSLNAAADIVEAAIKANKWGPSGDMQVNIPKGLVVAGLEACLKARRIPFTSLLVSLPPKQTKIDINSKSAQSGSAGEKTAGWVAVVTK